jgi:hypothetical protein
MSAGIDRRRPDFWDPIAFSVASLAAAFQYAADALKGEHTWELRITA